MSRQLYQASFMIDQLALMIHVSPLCILELIFIRGTPLVRIDGNGLYLLAMSYSNPLVLYIFNRKIQRLSEKCSSINYVVETPVQTKEIDHIGVYMWRKLCFTLF
jgi:hypothetical protein